MEPLDISSTDSESSDWDLEDYKAYNENDSCTKDSATSVPNTRVLPSSFVSSSLTSNAGSSQRAILAKRKAPMNGHSSHFNQDYDDQLHNFRRTLPSSLKQFSSSSRPSHLVKDVGSSRSHETYGQTWQSPVKAYNEDHFGRSSNDVMNGNRHGSRVLPQSMNPPMSVPTPQYGGAIELYRPAGVIDEQEVGDERLIYQTALQDLHQPITEADISSTDSESIDWYFEEYKAYHEIDSFTKDLATSVPNTRVLPSSFVSSSWTSNADVSSSDSESSDWDLERYKELNEPYMDMATSLLISESSLGMTSSGYRLCVSPFSSKGKAPTKDVMKDKHHGSRVVFPSVKPPMSIPTEQHGGTFFDICHPLGGFNEQTVSNARLVDEVALPGRNQPVTEANLPESINSALLGLKNPRFVTSVEKKKSSFQTEAVRQLTGSLTKVEGLRFAIVVARFNEIVSKLLLEGALDTFKKYLVRQEDIVVVWVPGSFEIGLVAEKLGKSGKYHAILCIGAVVRGDTTDYDVVANSAASGVLSAGLNSGVPCIFGVLTCDDMDKALSHAGGKAGNKGSEAALTAIEMASLFEHHLKE